MREDHGHDGELTLEEASWWFDKRKTIAVVGFSSSPLKPAHHVPVFMLKQGFSVIPVNPKYNEVEGLKCHHSLQEIPVAVDIVIIFRPSSEIPQLLEDAWRIGTKGVWVQVGIKNSKARERARQQGIKYIEDRCFKIEYLQWVLMLTKEGMFKKIHKMLS